MNVKFSFDETNVQVGFENQFVVKDFTDKTLVKLLMLKGDKGDTVSAEWGTITGTLSSQTDLKNALDSKANTSDLSSVATSGDYEDLTNTPTIPTKTSDLTNDSGFIDNTVNDLTNYTKTSDLSTVATSGSYNDLSNKPSIPTKTSDITNDSGFITSSYHDNTKVDKDSIARVNNVVSKNKININGYVAQQYNARISVKNNTARVTCLGDGQNMYSCIKIENINELLGKTCTFKATATSSSSNVPMARIYFGTDNAPTTEWANFDLYGQTSNTQITSTFPANMPSGCDGAYLLLYGNRNGTGFSAGAYADFTDIQIEEGSVATDYAPYLNLEEAMQENNIYSTNEIKIGTWIDGKPLYRKVIQPVIKIGANAIVSVPHGISNLSQVLKVDATLFWDNKTYPFPAIYDDLSKQVDINYIDSTNVYIKSFGDNWSTQITTIILEYTKTTD